MKKMRILALALAILLLLTGCGLEQVPSGTDATGGSQSTQGSQGGSDATVGTTVPTLPIPSGTYYNVDTDALPYTQEQLFEQLFDLDNKISLQLHMSDGELQKMQNDYERYSNMGSKSPIYRMADLDLTITTAQDTITYRIPEVGVRMKGNTSRTSFYNDHEGIYKSIHLKLSFQETFDDESYYGSDAKSWQDEQRKARKDRLFASLEKLDMRWNKNTDNTYIKETYAYEFYREQGVLAPHTNLASFDWAGVHMGVYTINEPVDKIFLEKNLKPEDLGGDLYKGGWSHTGASFTSLDSIGIENEDEGKFYAFDLKTNKKTSDHSALKGLITELNAGKLTKERLAEIVDMDYFLRYAAVSYFLGNPDDLRHNYNNFYVYFLQSSGKMILIPYDYDRCLGINRDWNPTRTGMTDENPFGRVQGALDPGWPEDQRAQKNPLFVYTVCMGGYYVRDFAQVLETVAASAMLKPETFAGYYQKAEANYRNDVNPSKELKNIGGRDLAFSLNKTSKDFSSGDNISFADYVEAKLKTFRYHMGKVEEYANKKLPVNANYYIRGTMNDWNIRDEYAMEEVDGLQVFRITARGEIKLKVYSKINDAWYGTECMDDSTTVPYETSGRTNIVLRSGKYTVIFNPDTQIVTVTAQEG